MLDLLEMIVHRRVQRLVVTDGQHLSRYDAKVVTTLCKLQGVEPELDQRMEIGVLPDVVLDDAEGVDETW